MMTRAPTDRSSRHKQVSLDESLVRSTANADVTATVTTAMVPSPASGRDGQNVPSVHIRGQDIALDTDDGKAFIADCARNLEGIKLDRDLQEDWGLDEQACRQMAENSSLLNRIKAEVQRRVQNGEAAREAAQRHFAKAPSILAAILENDTISPRHRIEAAKELRQVAKDANDHAAAGEKFTIVIDLGEDNLFEKEFYQPARLVNDDGDVQ